jgi:hypothetical protein
MEIIEVPVPPAVRVTLPGAAEHIGWKAAELVEIEQVIATGPTKPLVEVSVRVSELPVVAPEVKLSEGADALNVKVGAAGAVIVTLIDEVTVIAPLIPVTVTLRTPLVPAVVLTVSTLVPVPPNESGTEVGATVQVPAAVPLVLDTAQVKATAPAKPFVEASVKVSVLPVVAPAVRLSEGVVALSVKLGTGGAVTVTAIDEVTVMDPPTPVTVTLRVPLVPVVVLMVTTLVPVPLDASVTDGGPTAQVPAAVPLAVDTAQVRATVPENPLSDASAKVSALPVVAPARRVRLAEEGVREKEGGDGAPPAAAAAVRKLATSSEPRPVARS